MHPDFPLGNAPPTVRLCAAAAPARGRRHDRRHKTPDAVHQHDDRATDSLPWPMRTDPICRRVSGAGRRVPGDNYVSGRRVTGSPNNTAALTLAVVVRVSFASIVCTYAVRWCVYFTCPPWLGRYSKTISPRRGFTDFVYFPHLHRGYGSVRVRDANGYDNKHLLPAIIQSDFFFNYF